MRNGELLKNEKLVAVMLNNSKKLVRLRREVPHSGNAIDSLELMCRD